MLTKQIWGFALPRIWKRCQEVRAILLEKGTSIYTNKNSFALLQNRLVVFLSFEDDAHRSKHKCYFLQDVQIRIKITMS